MISVNNLYKKFGALTALNDVSVSFSTGNSYALIGPNGSGKTTLIKSILGLVIPSNGTIAVDGEDIRNNWAYRSKIGYMPQIGHYPANMRIGQVIDMIKNIRNHNTEYDEEMIAALKLNSMFDKRMHALSGGTRQKVSVALAFLFNPSIFILDEPTAGLDPVSVEIVKEKINSERAAGKLFIITSHIVSDLDELTSQIVYLFEGNVRYNDTIDSLKEITNTDKLGKAIARLIEGQSGRSERNAIKV